MLCLVPLITTHCNKYPTNPITDLQTFTIRHFPDTGRSYCHACGQPFNISILPNNAYHFTSHFLPSCSHNDQRVDSQIWKEQPIQILLMFFPIKMVQGKNYTSQASYMRQCYDYLMNLKIGIGTLSFICLTGGHCILQHCIWVQNSF